MSKAIVGLMLLLWASPLVLAAIATQTLPNPGSFNAESWTAVGESENSLFAGILSKDGQSKLAGVQYSCEAMEGQATMFHFAIPVSQLARLFVESELLPGVNNGRGELKMTVDDLQSITLSHVRAGMIEGPMMLVTSSDFPEDAVNHMMAGSRMRVDLIYNRNLMFTDTVTLNGSEEALSALDCAKA